MVALTTAAFDLNTEQISCESYVISEAARTVAMLPSWRIEYAQGKAAARVSRWSGCCHWTSVCIQASWTLLRYRGATDHVSADSTDGQFTQHKLANWPTFGRVVLAMHLVLS
jgi:hypothetical protein